MPVLLQRARPTKKIQRARTILLTQFWLMCAACALVAILVATYGLDLSAGLF